MSAYLKALGLHVYLATTKSSYINNGKHVEANAQSLIVLSQSLSKDHLSMVSHCDSVFAVWNILTSPEQQKQTMWRENLVEMSPTKLDS